MNALSFSQVKLDEPRPRERRGAFALAFLATLFTLPLLFVGGTVTTYRVGMAVPDWPSTFGENMITYNFWNAPLGVKLEHTHRLYGMAVGIATLILAGWLLAFDRRRWMKALGIVAVAAVIAQGILGGLRVTHVSTLLASVHGATAQAFFGLMVAICVFTGRDWRTERHTAVDHAHLRRRSFVLLTLVYGQIVLGSWVRHFGAASALWGHAVLAFGIWLPAILLTLRIEKGQSFLPSSLIWPGRALLASSSLQILLGIGALVSVWPYDGIPRPVSGSQAFFRTMHQTNAAILFASAVVLALRSFRHLTALSTTIASDAISATSAASQPAPLEWEAVA